VEPWRKRILAARSLPVLWWCDQQTFPSHECKLDPGIDGLIGPGMNALEIHCALLLSVNHYFQRTEWHQEREQLLSRLEERKWIDQAKRILSEIKNISEAEAYEFLRKQAMNERKRMADVATSIVKVYQLLQDENKGGRKR
jgi:response regulator NasT